MERKGNQGKPHQGNKSNYGQGNQNPHNKGQQNRRPNPTLDEEEKVSSVTKEVEQWGFLEKTQTPQNQNKKFPAKKQEGQQQKQHQNQTSRNQPSGLVGNQQNKFNSKTFDQQNVDKLKNQEQDSNNHGPRQQRGGPGQFNKRPQASTTSNVAIAKLPLVTNQFKLTLHSKYVIFTYAIEAISDQPDAKAKVRELIQRLDKDLKLVFMHYIHSGFNLFSPTCISEEVNFNMNLNNHQYTLRIRKVGQFNLDNLEESQSEKNPIQVTFLNLLIQKLMRSGTLKQIGKLPRFFRPSEKMTITDPQLGQLEVWPGYKASSYVYNSGIFLALESMNKFFRKQSCLDKIKDMLYENESVEAIDEFFRDRQVLTEWGSKRFYKISKVRMDMNPLKAKFQSDGNPVSVHAYFKEKYNIDLDKTQPLLEVGHRKDSILLPSQICYIESIPEALKRKKDLIAKFRKNPQEKIESVQQVVEELAQNPELQEWGISVDAKPYNFEARTLSMPFIITAKSNGQGRDIKDKNSFNQGILQPVVLQRNKWAIVYDLGDYNEANMIHEFFVEAGERLGLLVGEPFWIEVPERSSPQTFEKYINENVNENIKAVVVLLPKFNYYAHIKRALDRKGVISQLVQKSNMKKGQKNNNFGLQLAQELLKQLSAKAGGDLYHITLPKLKYKHTMLIGMDVCHYGHKSIVGFCATLNSNYSKYYSQIYYQQKGKEISEREDLEKAYMGAFEAYGQANGANVEHIIIFRDGVGDAMREQVRSEELMVLKSTIKKKFPITSPKITLVIVNKRINQRFFQITQSIKNPPAGTIIDNCMIYNGSDSNTYDFFLISQQTTQGCILPTHFFVSYDDSSIGKDVLQELTYNLCYYYYNWSGSIKVPAPCQYAHKVAKYTLDIQAKPKSTENLYFL